MLCGEFLKELEDVEESRITERVAKMKPDNVQVRPESYFYKFMSPMQDKRVSLKSSCSEFGLEIEKPMEGPSKLFFKKPDKEKGMLRQPIIVRKRYKSPGKARGGGLVPQAG